MIEVVLSADELSATVAALHDYRSQTTHYLRGYGDVDNTHDECCATARARATLRREGRDALNRQLRHIDSALLTLEPIDGNAAWGRRR